MGCTLDPSWVGRPGEGCNAIGSSLSKSWLLALGFIQFRPRLGTYLWVYDVCIQGGGGKLR